MESKGKVHCFFEQSGTFKREFIKLGIPAEDYDIQNNFGETDHTDDLFAEIEKALKYSKKNKLSDDEVKALKAERQELYKSFKQQRLAFLRGGATEGANPEQNSTYKVISDEFGDVIPSDILTCLNQNIASVYKAYSKEVQFGNRTIPNYKKGIPAPFSIKAGGALLLKKREDGSIYIRMPKGLEWDLAFGRDRSNNREIVERILSGQYDAGNSSIQQAKNGKCFLLLIVKIPKSNIRNLRYFL